MRDVDITVVVCRIKLEQNLLAPMGSTALSISRRMASALQPGFMDGSAVTVAMAMAPQSVKTESHIVRGIKTMVVSLKKMGLKMSTCFIVSTFSGPYRIPQSALGCDCPCIN